MPKKPAAAIQRAVIRAAAYSLRQSRPEEGTEPPPGLAYRMAQWETDVFSLSLALELVLGVSQERFRADCQGPKDKGTDDAAF